MAALSLCVLSDLHLDHEPFPTSIEGKPIDDGADLVVLAGDIADGATGLVWARETFPSKPIIVVPGNHEFYGQNHVRARRTMREEARHLGIHWLDRSSVVISGVRFLGTTLWTDFRLLGEERRVASMERAGSAMNDYRKITKDHEEAWMDARPGGRSKNRQQPLDPVDTAYEHELSVRWLEEQLATQRNDSEPFSKTVVVTHHAPHLLSVPERFHGHHLSPSYSTDLSRLMGMAALWIHGHIHHAVDYNVSGTRMVCNPRGYPGENLRPGEIGFDPLRRYVV
jgi:Icc-related predicted phosphoesterase